MAWREKLTSIGAFLRDRWLSIFFAAAVVIVALVVVRPFDTVPDPGGDDIAVAWNESIGRLGITPVYPPTEDLSVGDIWAVVSEIDKGTKVRQLNSTPLLGKAVRIGHIDLRDQILTSAQHPTFADTTEPVANSKLWKQERWEVATGAAANDRIPLSLIAFPGVTINHQSRTGAQLGATAGWFGVQRQREQQEQIRIKAAESYGIQTAAAVFILNKWCKGSEMCQDANVRKLMSYTVGEQVLEATSNAYNYRLGLQLVTRVFLMRQIEHSRSSDDARGAAMQIGDVKSDVGGNAGQGTTPGAAGAPPLTPGTANGGRLSQMSQDALGLSMTETFQRPVAFGYRSVTIALEPSQPRDKR